MVAEATPQKRQPSIIRVNAYLCEIIKPKPVILVEVGWSGWLSGWLFGWQVEKQEVTKQGYDDNESRSDFDRKDYPGMLA